MYTKSVVRRWCMDGVDVFCFEVSRVSQPARDTHTPNQTRPSRLVRACARSRTVVGLLPLEVRDGLDGELGDHGDEALLLVLRAAPEPATWGEEGVECEVGVGNGLKKKVR